MYATHSRYYIFGFFCCRLLFWLFLPFSCWQDMIVLITGRRVFMLHGGGGSGGVDSATSAASKRHIYGVVEWEVDFSLLVWLETEIDGGAGGGVSSASPAHPSGERQAASLSMYHFPDLCAEATGNGGGAGSAGKY